MVRINIINPEQLADQHLVAEYNEILMLFGTVKKHPKLKNQPEFYKLNKGHITFFKDKLLYLRNRHELLKKEMIKRGFKPEKTIVLSDFSKELLNDWTPRTQDFKIIKERLKEKLELKPYFYTYFGEHKSKSFFLNLLK